MSDPQLIKLGSWRLWPDALIRSAGFSIEHAVDALTGFGLPLSTSGTASQDLDWAEHMADASRRLNVALNGPMVRAALTWINQDAWTTGLSQLSRTDVTIRNSRRRSRERLAVNYIQRLSLKNDSVGFYGPMAWAHLDPALSTSKIVASEALIDASSVHFEAWAVEELGRAIPLTLGIDDADAPRRSPMVHLSSQVVMDWSDFELSSVCAELVRRADGLLSRAALLASVTSSVISYDTAVGALDECLERGWITGGVSLSPSVHSESQLQQIFSTHPRGPELTQVLQPFLDLRDQLGREPTNFNAVGSLMNKLRTSFTEITGNDARHSAGQMYAGRELVCLEARRGLNATFGRDALEAIGPLSSLLDAVKWLLAEIADQIDPVLQDLAGRSRNALEFWLLSLQEVAPLIDDITARAVDEFQQRLGAALRHANSNPDEFNRLVQQRFPRRVLRWPEAQWVSPDVLLTRGPEGWGAVLGEIHPVSNTLDYQCVASILPDPNRLADLLDATTPKPRLLVVPRRASSGAGFTARTLPAARRPNERQLVLTQNHVAFDGERSIHGVDCPIRYAEGRYHIEVGDQEHELISLLSDWMRHVLLDHFDLSAPGSHPRMEVGPLTVVRQKWFIPAAELSSFTTVPEERQAFDGFRRLTHDRGMPPLIYVKLPNETKPLPVLVESPGSVLAFRHNLRQAMKKRDFVGITAVEGLPTAPQTWLQVANEKYCSEHRFVAYLEDPS